MDIPTSADRVPAHTAPRTNEQIRVETERRLYYFSVHPEQIDDRLHELDKEWDIERALETNAATLALTGAVLAATASRKWAILPAVVTAFLLQHGVQGWCPPLPILRRIGFRTPQEIEAERYALKALRGDFRNVRPDDNGRSAIEATGRFTNARHEDGQRTSNGSSSPNVATDGQRPQFAGH